MFRKRDSNQMESEGEDERIAEETPEPVAEEVSEAVVEETSETVVEPLPNPDPVDEPSKGSIDDTDLPESQPLSAAPKSAAASVSPAASSDTANKRLIVGQGIRLSGEINSCDRLVVEGEVEVTLNDTLALEIASSGRFTGGCEVEEADISGIYEGDLTVRNTLFVRGTGRITGTIRYGQLELERGGQIAGNISVLGEGQGALGGDAKARAPKAPLFGGSTG
jgi:cytoskeletal protein CcmA (bactofilin family)